MKKTIAGILLATAMLACAACGQKNGATSAQSTGSQSVQGEISDNIYGTYNGTDLYSGIPFSVFEEDGWELADGYSKDDSDLNFVNKKYPGYDLYIYNDAVGSKLSDIPVSDFVLSLLEKGPKDPCPPMTQKGLTWGATREEVEAVYGLPTYVDESNYDYTQYDYYYLYCTDTPEVDKRVEFYFNGEDAPVSGLVGMGLTQIGYSPYPSGTCQENLDRFVNGESAATSVDDNGKVTYVFLDEMDDYSVGERVDIDNDGEAEQLFDGPFGIRIIDAFYPLENFFRMYCYDFGGENGATAACVKYQDASWVLVQDVAEDHAAYTMIKFSGMQNEVERFEFGWKTSADGSKNYYQNENGISEDDFNQLFGAIDM